MNDIKPKLHQVLERFPNALAAEQQFVDFLTLLNKWNNAYNLTAIKDPFEQITKHIADSLAIADYLNGKNIADIGSGAGFPGIPLALVHPEKQFTLIDSNSKKTRFITQAINELAVSNVHVTHSRVEAFAPAIKFDTITSRAFSSLADFLQLTQHLMSKEGYWLAMKGEYPTQEIANIPQDFRVVNVRELEIEDLGAKRHLVIIKKA